jgi:hypothetical protein
MRREVILAHDDTAAAAQILAWIARPHRQADAEIVLKQFVMKYAQMAGWTPDGVVLERPSRLEPRLLTLQGDVQKAIETARWFQAIALRGDKSAAFTKFRPISKRELAADYSGYRQDEDAIGPKIQRLWKTREPVVHLCLAACNAIGRMQLERAQKGLDLRLPMFHAGEWVGEAIAQAEGWARTASAFGIVGENSLIHFSR